MTAYYNEHDPYAAQWLRNLIAGGHIAPGVVDERSIEDVLPSDLDGFTQCHFFAGIGVWSYALRRAGWPDSRPVWTASCPCQPFSTAGAGAGFDDSRHLWPAFAWLAWQHDPAVVFGEQVASKDAGPWVDLVQADLEALGYAFGAVAFPAAGVGAPHIRDRLYWVADAQRDGFYRAPGPAPEPRGNGAHGRVFVGGGSGPSDRLGDPDGAGLPERFGVGGIPSGACGADTRQAIERTGVYVGGVAHASSERRNGVNPPIQWEESRRVAGDSLETIGCGTVNGFWHGADWLSCRDDRWRPVEPGAFPLAPGLAAGVGSVQPGVLKLVRSNRVGRLKGYGNALNAEAATAFIGSYLAS